MIITYLLNTEEVVSIIMGFPVVWEENNKLWMEGASNPLLNNLNKAGWGIYKDKEITCPQDEHGDDLPLYLYDLELEPITHADLPRSMHIGALKEVGVVAGSPRCVVLRKYYGQTFEVPNCRVSRSAYDAYQAGHIEVFDPAYTIDSPQNENCFVLIYFISENPFNEELEIPVVIDKIIK